MNLNLTLAKTALITLGLLFSFSFAQEPDASMETRQKAVLSALDSIEENVIGFALNGRAKSGILTSTLASKALPNEEPVSEYSAFTDFLLGISIRPSKETKATFDLRFHKDWQSAYREGNNSPTIRWWSYDGSILDKKLKFNLGTMRIAYTPLTIYLPEPNLIMEPEIFSDLKKEAMEDRYLDGTNRRLLQGINLEFGTSVGVIDNILLQGTLVRLRKAANAYDVASFDFDPNRDRYSAAARFGIETFGVFLGVNDVYTFNRLSSVTRNGGKTPDSFEPITYEHNNVLSAELSYNSKKLSLKSISFGAGAEYAISNWSLKRDTMKEVRDPVRTLYLDIANLPSITGPYRESPLPNYYVYYRDEEPTKLGYEYEFKKIDSYENKGALLANAFVAFNQNPFEAKLSGHFLQVDKYFESELAASPAYLPYLPILNSNANLESALSAFRTGSLENMYYSLYYSLPLNLLTVLSNDKLNPGDPKSLGATSFYQASVLNNNYKFAQYYRNAYTQQTFTRLERDSVRTRLDPAVNMALPYGYATPNRKGGDVDLDFTWNNAVKVKGVFGTYSAEDEGDYTRLGGGLEVNIARIVGLSKALTISGSYEQNKEENGLYNPQTDRIMAGAKVGIWRGLSLIGGFQQLSKEFKNPMSLGIIVVPNEPNESNELKKTSESFINKTGETLIIGGPQIKISERAEFSLQGGLLANSISATTFVKKVKDEFEEEEIKSEKLNLDKYIISGIVTVEF